MTGPSNDAENQKAVPQRAVFIIGAGRSGTSTIARAVAALGVDLGNHFKRANRKNPTGFFEDAALLALSKAVRRRLSIRPESLRLIEPDELQGPAMQELRHKAIELISQRFGTSPIWGFKYGRTLRILPFWEPVLDTLDIEPSYVIALRNPLSVARSRARLNQRRGRQEVSDLEWLVGIVPYLARTRPHRLIVVDYDLLMENPQEQLHRLARRLELATATDTGNADLDQRISDYVNTFINPGLRHTRFSDNDLDTCAELNPLTRDGFRLLHKLASDDMSPNSDEFWNQWQAIEQGVENLAPILRLLDSCEKERFRAITNPLGPLQSLILLQNVLRR